MTTINPSVADEHVADSIDCLKDAANNIKRVRQSYPQVERLLDEAAVHIDGARSKLKETQAELNKLANK